MPGKGTMNLENGEKSSETYKINFNSNKYASGVYSYPLKANGIALKKRYCWD